METKRLRVEFHCHTEYSKDSLTSVETLLRVCRQRGIDRLVITDHNTIAGGLRAKAQDPERVIIGEEIKTQAGELLAFFVKKHVPPFLSPREAIQQLKEQGAFISVSHPFDRWRNGHWKQDVLLEILPLIDAIETFNARIIWPQSNRAAQDFARTHRLLGTVGSDAHTAFEVGKATMRLAHFDDAQSLRESLQNPQSQVSLSPFWVHFFSRYAVWRKRISGVSSGSQV